MNMPLGFLLGSGIFIIFALILVLLSLYQEVKKLREKLFYYNRKYLYKSGYMTGYGSYELVSLSGGKSWYAAQTGLVDTTPWHYEVTDVRILGPAEEIYPGLLSKLNGMETLMKHITENGPLTLTGERTQKDIQLLREAGFEIQS